MAVKPGEAKCSVCGKPAPEWTRNVDGTYTHDECAKQTASR